VARNLDYAKPGRPYLDGIEYTIIANRSTAILAFVAGKFDMTFAYEVSIPLVKQVQSQAPQAMRSQADERQRESARHKCAAV
jgi:peptide/nickel transport system substrate-binding protein